MKTGMLWFDNQGAIEERIRRAAAYYRRKYGIMPNICFVDRSQHTVDQVDGITIRPDQHILKNHYWIANDEQKAG